LAPSLSAIIKSGVTGTTQHDFLAHEPKSNKAAKKNESRHFFITVKQRRVGNKGCTKGIQIKGHALGYLICAQSCPMIYSMVKAPG
jgi:hypothetical protein